MGGGCERWGGPATLPTSTQSHRQRKPAAWVQCGPGDDLRDPCRDRRTSKDCVSCGSQSCSATEGVSEPRWQPCYWGIREKGVQPSPRPCPSCRVYGLIPGRDKELARIAGHYLKSDCNSAFRVSSGMGLGAQTQGRLLFWMFL